MSFGICNSIIIRVSVSLNLFLGPQGPKRFFERSNKRHEEYGLDSAQQISSAGQT